MTRRRDGSSYQKDREKVEVIKRDFLDAYDKVVEEGFEPTLVRVLGRIPYVVNTRFAQEIRRDLVESGDLPEPRRGSVPRVVPEVHRKVVYYLDREAISKEIVQVRVEAAIRDEALMDRSHFHREDMTARAAAERRGEMVPSWDPVLEGPTNAAVSRWAIKRFWEAWKAIRDAKGKTRGSGKVLSVVPGDDGHTGLEVANRQGPAREWPLHDDRAFRSA
jgi:hypothetical protein